MPLETELVRKTPPEEELSDKRCGLALPFAELAERDFSLARLKVELATFDGQYLREIGVLDVELDKWNARIADLKAERDGTSDAKLAAFQSRQPADETSAAHGRASGASEFTPLSEPKNSTRKS